VSWLRTALSFLPRADLSEKMFASMDTHIEANKAVVRRFNREVIEAQNRESFQALLAPDFVNRTARPGVDPGPAGMRVVFDALHAGLSDLKVTIHRQVAEGDLVTTHKTISGQHTGPLFGVPATQQAVAIDVMDMVRVRDGRYVEHWGVNTISALLAQLAKP
jgi:predicted SnoaL-like aldol condensation-catalyzing enzyme